MRRPALLVAGLALAALGAVAYSRSGLLNLPRVPEIGAAEAGLGRLGEMRLVEERLAAAGAGGLQDLARAVAADPGNLALGNAFRMRVFHLKRQRIREARRRGELVPELPEPLAREPLRTFRQLARQHPRLREAKLQLAFALIDEMLLYPALETRAPASVEAVETLTAIIEAPDGSGRYYLPALYARGLNHLYRPANMVWPARLAAPPDAASRDLALCAAVGRRIDGLSRELQASLYLDLGDAYAKEGRLALARSWWQIGRNRSDFEPYRGRFLRRLAWRDEEAPANLERALEERMAETDPPLSDISFVWK